jgi:NAD(P)-dependent dehydrogenase (short-subunit alcohol dehydrogenase family)
LGITRALADEGTNLVVSSVRDSRNREAVKHLSKFNVSMSHFVCDISDRGSVEALADHAWKEFGHVDMIFNNAGVSSEPTQLIDGKEADFRWLLDVNVIGTWNGCSVFGKNSVNKIRLHT